MKKSLVRYDAGEVDGLILTLRGKRVIRDADLARIYGVTTFRLNEAVKRNRERFPDDFAFQLVPEEVASLISQFAISSSGHGGLRKPPWVFTEHGAIMAANILRSPRAVRMSIFVIRAFVRMRQELMTRHEMEKRLDQIEKILLVHDDALKDLYEKLRPLLLPPPEPEKKPIGFQVRERRTRYRRTRR
ncbi:MAG: ORF6N domain-containing protein [Verrucomicrobia bacterium]|nr:ORF6N domain-containing protein [Verrucomicrobiota bacterium]